LMRRLNKTSYTSSFTLIDLEETPPSMVAFYWIASVSWYCSPWYQWYRSNPKWSRHICWNPATSERSSQSCCVGAARRVERVGACAVGICSGGNAELSLQVVWRWGFVCINIEGCLRWCWRKAFSLSAFSSDLEDCCFVLFGVICSGFAHS